MKPSAFEYLVPETLEEALDMLAAHSGEAKIIAGGQSLIPAMNFRLLQPTLLIDINHITELNYIHPVDGGGVRIGALTRQRRIERDPVVAERAPLLHETMPFIAHPQIRNRGTIGGSLVHADPAAELPVISLALSARFRYQSTAGERWLDAADCFHFMFTTDIQPDELLVEIQIPPLQERAGWAFTEFSRRHGDYALMGVAAFVTLDEAGTCTSARLAYLNAADVPLLAHEAAALLTGQLPSDALFSEAAALASSSEISPMGSVHAAPDYQRHLAEILTVRVLRKAFARAQGGM